MDAGAVSNANAGLEVPAIPDHILLHKIAKGSYGEIWLGRCALGHYRAVKIVRRAKFSDPKPYEREFKGIRNFEPVSREHECFVDVLQVGEDKENGFFYYVMELADDAAKAGGQADNSIGNGRLSRADFKEETVSSARDTNASLINAEYIPHTLSYEIRKRSPLPVEEVVGLGVALLEGLQFLHEKGLVHRDIKPSNIIFVGAQPKLADVGLVAELEETLSVVGTLGYMPPEGPGTPQADLYSLGKVLYEAATGNDRQQFPELPVAEDCDGLEPRLREFNQVLLKACANQPERRYHSAAAMLDDLKLLQDGRSLVRRARRNKLLKAAGVTVALAGVLIAVLLAPNGDMIIPELSDDFSAGYLDTNKWTLMQTNWFPLGHPNNQGSNTIHVGQAKGQLVFQVTSQHDGGWSTSVGAWMDSRQDLRKLGECWVRIEMEGVYRHGGTIICISDGRPPLNVDAPESGRLTTMFSSQPGIETRLNKTETLIHLLPDFQAAVVYPDAGIPESYEVVDLSGLEAWHLRFGCTAVSASGTDASKAVLTLNRVQTLRRRPSNVAIGFAVALPAKTPLSGARVIDHHGMRVAETLANGAFKFTTTSWPARIQVLHEDFEAPGEKEISGDPRARKPVRFELQKRKCGFGDVVDVIPHEAISIAFLGDQLFSLGIEYTSPTNAATLFIPIDVQAKKALAPTWRFSVGDHALTSMAQCGDRIFGSWVHPGSVYELNPKEERVRLVAKPTTQDGHFIDWPWAAAFDGEFLWLVESSEYIKSFGFGLHAFDPQTHQIRHSIPAEDKGVRGIAWDTDARTFWIASTRGDVYELDREKAIRQGRMEPARGRSFRGHYISLAYKQNYLWGFDPAKKQLCKIKIRE